MQRSAIILIIVAAVGIGSMLYLLGGTANASGREETYKPMRGSYKTPFETHVDEALSANPRLADFFEKLDGLHEKHAELSKKCAEYQAHLDQYFEGAGSMSSQIQDSNLKAQVDARLGAERDTIAERHAALTQERERLELIMHKADDVAKSVRVIASISFLRKWADENRPDPAALNALSKAYADLLQESESAAKPATALP